jgi:hypothetical protein
MSALAGSSSLSQLLAWPTEHLTEAADNWDTTGERCYGVANQVWRDALSIDWQGEAADALRTATHADMMTTSAVADQLQAAAKVARSGASELYTARSRVRYAVEDARTAGFNVGEDLSVIDRSSGGSPVQLAVRQAQAQTFAADIRQRAAQLVALDQQVAGNVTTAMAGIRDTFPQNPAAGTPPKDNHVQSVDHHWKQDPAPPPGPDSDPPWRNLPSPRTWEEVRNALRQLHRGKNEPNRQLDTPEEIREFWDWLTKGAVGDLPHSGGFPRKELEDGTAIKFRPESGSGGPTVEVVPPGATKGPKVHLPLPFVNDPPELPGIGEHPPAALPPLSTGHPPPQVLLPTQFPDPADVPPWLKDPSPPGFRINPVQPPPVFEWDQPDAPLAPVPQPAAPRGESSWLPEIGHDLGEAGEKTFEWLVVAGALAGGLFGVGGQSGEVPAP